MNGLILLNKPRGESSFRALSPVKRSLPRKHKVGHTGTLDPFADGLLICMVGSYTKLTEFAHSLPKTYTAELKLGEQTDTLDPSGSVVHRCENDVSLDSEVVTEVFSRFTGQISQIPPVYSAIHINGKRAYQRAQAGEDIAMPVRNVRIHTLQLEKILQPDIIRFKVSCSTGTYIRTLAADIAAALGTCGYLTALTRNSIGSFSLDQAIDPTLLSKGECQLSQCIHDGFAVYSLVTGNPAILIKDSFVSSFCSGKKILQTWFAEPLNAGVHIGVFSTSGLLLGQVNTLNSEVTVYDFVVPNRQADWQ